MGEGGRESVCRETRDLFLAEGVHSNLPSGRQSQALDIYELVSLVWTQHMAYHHAAELCALTFAPLFPQSGALHP